MVVKPLKGGSYNEKNTLTIEYTLLSGNRLNTNLQDGFIRQVCLIKDTTNYIFVDQPAIPHPEQASNGIRNHTRRNLIIKDAV